LGIEIRLAVEDDYPWLLEQSKLFTEFYGTSKKLYSDHMPKVIQDLVEKHITLVSQDGRNLTGLISGLYTTNFFNPDLKILAEVAWWVTPKYRNTRSGLMLLNEFVKMGKELEVDWITMSLEHHSPVNPKCLAKRGFKSQEHAFLMEV
jgi:hypothetical protein